VQGRGLSRNHQQGLTDEENAAPASAPSARRKDAKRDLAISDEPKKRGNNAISVSTGTNLTTRAAAAEASPVRRGRPRNVERREEIARAATCVFAERGYHGATMREVAEACAMGETLLYRYFGRKEALLSAVAERALRRLRGAADAVAAAAGRGLGARDYFATSARIVLHHVDEQSAWYAASLGGLPLLAEQRELLRASRERLFQTIAAYPPLRHECRDPYAAVRIACGAIESLVLAQNRVAFEPAGAELRALYLDELIETILYGAGVRPAFDRRPRSS